VPGLFVGGGSSSDSPSGSSRHLVSATDMNMSVNVGKVILKNQLDATITIY